MQRERQLHAPCAAAGDQDPPRGARLERRQPLEELGHGPHRQRHRRQPRQAKAGGRRSQVEGCEVVAQRGPVLEKKPPRPRVDAAQASEDDSAAGGAREGGHVDLRLSRGVPAGDHAGRHPRINRDRAVEHGRQACAAVRPPREPPEHLDVGMAAADQHDVAHEPLPPAYRRQASTFLNKARSAGVKRVRLYASAARFTTSDWVG